MELTLTHKRILKNNYMEIKIKQLNKVINNKITQNKKD